MTVQSALVDDLLAECGELDAFVSGLPLCDMDRVTPFFDWTVRDQLLHLYQVDRFGLISLQTPDRFPATVANVRQHQAACIELSAAIREEFRHVSHADVIAAWREGYVGVADALRNASLDTRLTWFGPPMGVASFVTARLMEVWAHGQDIHDLYASGRSAGPRIRHVCDLGVRTFGWSFRNRGLDVPERPTVALSSPTGEEWVWPGPGDDRISGRAEDFALIVTQRRAPQDTAITAEGATARQWLEIAQCFAGAPQQPALPGSRPRLAALA